VHGMGFDCVILVHMMQNCDQLVQNEIDVWSVYFYQLIFYYVHKLVGMLMIIDHYVETVQKHFYSLLDELDAYMNTLAVPVRNN